MKAYIQTDKEGDFYNVNAFVAAVGFKTLGFEIEKYFDVEEITSKNPESIVVGGVGMIRKRLTQLGIDRPEELEYPSELRQFLNRKIWKSTLNELIQSNASNIFIKPVETKLFQGKVINGFSDYVGLNFNHEVDIWCSEPIEIVTEWRCFVRYNELIDVRFYKGSWDRKLDLDIVRKAISLYENQPAAYCLDFGVDADGKYYLIEVNDGHSLGTYGMGAISYAKFLSARWAQISNTNDFLYF